MLTVTRQISEQAKLHPDTVALQCGDDALSYGELQLRAYHFAEYLRRQARVSGGTVAICMERSVDWIVAALAAMRAGAAYVPLDPAWPDARIKYAVENSGAAALVARQATLERLQLGVPGIDPSRDAPAIAEMSGIMDDTSPDTLAYVIYTSGSTGVPKGVEITHANLTHLVKWHREAFKLSPQDRASHIAGLGFDAAAWEIWPALCAGATLCIPGEAVRTSAELVRSWMLRENITIGFVPTLYAASMMEMEWPSSTALRTLLTGGDVLHLGPARRLPFDVVNNYGPTECTVLATSSVLEVGASGAPPIGAPISGATIHLLDENRNEVPAGEPGEIYIGGNGVGRGYRNLPELTKERFVADPFATTPGARLYRTGDRGMLRPDGQIQFLGRLDRQVKIRGKRMELDEVGNVLSQHAGVSFATVVATSFSTKEDKQLVAYVVFKADCEPTRDDLVMHLSQNLPDFMIPGVFVRLQSLPMSASGKLDFAALPAPSDTNVLQSGPKKPVPESVSKNECATPLEQQLLDIIRNLLDGREVGVDDSVFLIGGDSLFGTQLIIMMQNKFGVELTFDQLFETPTVRGLARLVGEMRISEELEGIVNPVPAQGPASCEVRLQSMGLAGAQDRKETSLPAGVIARQKETSSNPIFWVHYLNLSLDRALGGDRQMTYLILTPEDMTALDQTPTLNTVAARFVQKILMTQPEGPYAIGGYCIGAVLAYEIAIQLQKAGHAIELVMLLDPPAPSYLRMRYPLGPRLSNPGYILKRIRKLGLRASGLKIWERAAEILHQFGLAESPKAKTSAAQQLIEAASFDYHAEPYEGRVLLLLAADRAPHVNFLPEWQTLIPNDLHFEYVGGHHSELMNQPYVQRIADAITTHLEYASRASANASDPAVPVLPEASTSDIDLVLSLQDDSGNVEHRNGGDAVGVWVPEYLQNGNSALK